MALRACEICGGSDFRPLFEKEAHTFVACRSCGLERIDPAPTDEELARIYGAHYYDAWGLHEAEDEVRRLKDGTFRPVIRSLGLAPGKKLLDCGAATGFLMEVARSEKLDPYGVELSAFGAKKIAEQFGAAHVFQGELERASFEGVRDGDFSAITMFDFLEHVRDPLGVARRAHALLESGGVVAVNAPRVGSLTHRVMGASWTHYKIEHLYYFSEENLGTLLRKAGFRKVWRGRPWKTMTLGYIQNQFARYPNPVLTRVANALGAAAPAPLLRARFRILMGELLVFAQK